MKKTLAIILSIIMVISILPVAAFAENGPKPYNEEDDLSAYIYAFEVDSEGEMAMDDEGYPIATYLIFSADEADADLIDEPEGVYYDYESNTLFLDNLYYPELAFETNGMGDDFTVNVKGICEAAKFNVWGDNYGGSIKFDGPGKLILNGEGYCEFGLLLNGEESATKLDFGEKVTVEIYGGEDSDFSCIVTETTIADAAQAIVFENGEQYDVFGGVMHESENVTVEGIYSASPEEAPVYYQINNDEDPEGLYAYEIEEFVNEDDSVETMYFIYKMRYIDEYDAYIPDSSFMDGDGYLAISASDVAEVGYTPVVDGDEPVVFDAGEPVVYYQVMLGADADGNYYGVAFVINDIDFETGEIDLTFTVYDLIPIEGYSDLYYLEENTDVNIEDLSPVEEITEIYEGLYEYYITDSIFSYVGTKFPDVAADSWFYEAAMYNAYNGFIGGYANGKFGPSDALQRQDFVVILARIAGADVSSYTSCALSDVKMDKYYGPSVAWAVDKGIIKGYTNGKFGVGDKITREQVATILYRLIGAPEMDDAAAIIAKFPDAGRVSDFAVDAIAWANQNGIINGKKDGTLAPTATASRAEIATIIMRMDRQGMFDLKA